MRRLEEIESRTDRGGQRNPDVGVRCPECRMGLGAHDIRDPQCIGYVQEGAA